MCSQSSGSLLRLQVVADADPTALLRVLERFQNLDIVPRRITAEFGTNNILHVAVDVFGAIYPTILNDSCRQIPLQLRVGMDAA
jgi:hypothetical protein